MKWMTVWKRHRSENQIDPGDQVLCLGSCFAEHVGQFLEENKSSILLNPGGIMYNPMSIYQNAMDWLNGDSTAKRIVQWDELFHSLDHHGKMSGFSEERVRDNIDKADSLAFEAMKTAKLGIITFGSAWIYRWKEDGQIVANCHKIPAEKYEKGILSKEEIVNSWSKLIERWKSSNPGLRLILTVSPVRHIRDGLIENQRSKATLLLAVAELVEKFDNVEYFPSYEIMIDELRDYRFYAEDLVHPTQLAIDYVMSVFSACYFSSQLTSLSQEIRSLKKAITHRPFFPETDSYHRHLQKTQLKLNELIKEYPQLDWIEEESKIAGLWDQTIRST